MFKEVEDLEVAVKGEPIMIKRLAIAIVALTLGSSAFAEGAGSDVNVRLNSLGLLVNALELAADFKISDSVTLGPRLIGVNRTKDNTKYNIGALGISAVFYLSGPALSRGWYISPFLDLGSLKVTDVPSSNTAQFNGSELGVAFGYQWFWDSGFNLGFDLALGRYSFPENVNVTDSAGNTTSVAVTYTGGFGYPELWLGFAW